MEYYEKMTWPDYANGYDLTYDEDGYICIAEDDNN